MLVGTGIGIRDGAGVGKNVGALVGADVGVADGVNVGVDVGALVGADVGAADGVNVGENVGDGVGRDVCSSSHTHASDAAQSWPYQSPPEPWYAQLSLGTPAFQLVNVLSQP